MRGYGWRPHLSLVNVPLFSISFDRLYGHLPWHYRSTRGAVAHINLNMHAPRLMMFSTVVSMCKRAFVRDK